MAKKSNPGTTNLVVQKLSITQVNRTNVDIKKWRSAVTSAESVQNPSRSTLYDLYAELLLDAHLQSVLEKRRTAVMNVPVTFRTDGDIDEELEMLIQSPWFSRMIADVLDTKFWGHTLLQFRKDGVFIDYDLIPRKHVMPERGIVKLNQNDSTGLPYRDGAIPGVMEVGSRTDLGLLCQAAPWVIYKRNCMGDYAQYAELFGMPIRKGTYDGYDEIARQKLLNDLAEMGSAGVFVHPEGTSVDFVESTQKGGSNEVYTGLINIANAEISKLILGNTLTTDVGQSGTQALGTIHREVEEQIMQSDRRFVTEVLNYHLSDVLTAFGYNLENGEFAFQDEESIPLKDQIDVLVKARNELKLPISDDHLYETLGIPKPENYDELKAKAETALKETKDPVAQQQNSDPVKRQGPAAQQRNRKGFFGFFR
jgi:phage gp29-like protein